MAVRRDGLPIELTSRHHEAWKDADAVDALIELYNLEVVTRTRLSIAASTWWDRFDAVRDAWCRANGLMDPTWHSGVDHRRAREAGIDMSSSSRYRLRGPDSPAWLGDGSS